MRMFLDADSCPVKIRRIILRASQRLGVETFFVANRPISIEGSDFASQVVVEVEQDAADNYIVKHCVPGDLVITRDIPLAAEIVEKNVTVINDRGVEYTADNVRQRLSMRNFMYDLREMGISPEKTSVFSEKDVRAFASQFDKVLSKMVK